MANKIYVVTTTTKFITKYVVAADSPPDGPSVLGMVKDGYIPEFDQDYDSEVVDTIEEVDKESYLKMWDTNPDASKISEKERLEFITQLGSVPELPNDSE